VSLEQPPGGGGLSALAPPRPGTPPCGVLPPGRGGRQGKGQQEKQLARIEKGKEKNNNKKIKQEEAGLWDIFKAQPDAGRPSPRKTRHASESHDSNGRNAGCGRCAEVPHTLELPWLSGGKMVPARRPCCF